MALNLQSKTTVYGHQFSLNVAKKTGQKAWDGKDAYAHFCLIQLGDDEEYAERKAAEIVECFGRDQFVFTLKADPKVASYSNEV